MNNYLDHADKVKFVDGLLDRSQDWQWFIDLIHETYDTHEITSWETFESNTHALREVYGRFLKILDHSDKHWVFLKNEFADLWEVARYFTGKQSLDECRKQMTTTYGKVMLFCVWITKLSNASQEPNPNHIYNTRILNLRNYFQLIDITPFLAEEEALLDYAAEIDIEGFSQPINYLKDNLSQIEHTYNEEFFVKNKDRLINYDAFSYQTISAEPGVSWQEMYLMDMMAVSIRDQTLQPLFSSNVSKTPDFDLWTSNILCKLKEFFHHECADFVVDTISYVLHKTPLPLKTKLTHLRLLCDAFSGQEKLQHIFTSSSFEVISMLFRDANLKDCVIDPIYLEFIRSIQSIDDVQFTIRLRKKHLPISKQQSLDIKEHLKSKFTEITSIEDAYELSKYLADDDIPAVIDAAHLASVCTTFDLIVESTQGPVVASLFFEYMVFLLKVNERNQTVNKQNVHAEMIRIQRLWQSVFFNRQVKHMQTFTQEIQIPSSNIDAFNDFTLLNPIFFAQQCIPCTKDKLIEIMQCVSDNPLIHLVHRTTLYPTFPISGARINLDRHDIDNLLAEQIERLLSEVGYKFLNILEVDAYISDIHERYSQNTRMMSGFFTRLTDLFAIIQAETEFELLPVSEEPSLAMITQFFPVLELRIREFAALFGIFPFKKKITEFMQYNDPSALLREILLRIYTEQGSFENVPDLLFVYNNMYNSNSLNVRNECIHGRDYLSGSSLLLALKVTMLSIYMIVFRIRTINENVSDILELPEKLETNSEFP